MLRICVLRAAYLEPNEQSGLNSPVAMARSLASARLDTAARLNESGQLRSELAAVRAHLADAEARVRVVAESTA